MKAVGEAGKRVNGSDTPRGPFCSFEEVIESFYLETKDGLFFAVKGLEHPPDRRIAVLRYAPDATTGSRAKDGKSYRRLYHFEEQEQLIKSTYPQYFEYDPVFQANLQSVPLSMVFRIYDPRCKFPELAESPDRTEIEEDALAFLQFLQSESQVEPSVLGITGSILTGLYTDKSDLDAVVFGTQNCRKVYHALRRILNVAHGVNLHRLDAAGMQELFAQRASDTRLKYDEFLKLENRKVNQGVFRKRTYFVRFVKGAHEIREVHGHLRYTRQGRAAISASIADDQESIFTPCRYLLSNVRILDGPQLPDLNEIVSFRGRFCEQARAGESVIASGMLERVESNRGEAWHRLLLGNYFEDTMSVLTG